MSGSGIAAFIGGAAPGVAQGVGKAVNSYQDYQADKASDAMNANDAGGGAGAQPMADANHPVWGLLSSLAGGGAPAPVGGTNAGPPMQGIPTQNQMMGAPGAQPMQYQRGGPVGYEDGGEVTDHNGNPIHKLTGWDLAKQAVSEVGEHLFGSGAGAKAAAASRSSTDGAQSQVDKQVNGYQNGGLVRQNFGGTVIKPAFERGPALPIGSNMSMGQGVTPAGTEGQILTMDAGGVVPDGFHEQQGISGVPMSGRGAAFVEGMQAGQNIGHNIAQAWHEHQARTAAADYVQQATSADVDQANAPDQPAPGGIHGALDDAKNHVEGFFQHLWNGTLNDQHKPNADQAIPTPGAPPPAGAVPTPALPATPSSGAAPTPSGVAPPPTAPPGGQALPANAPPPGTQPGSPPAAGAAPVPKGPQPLPGVSPQVQQQVSAQEAQSVDQNPNVKAGIADKSPADSGKPHSLTPEYWSKLNDLKTKAVMAAARAGEDPAKVYESLTAMQTAHFQGQVLKQAATAARAFDNGDIPNTIQALKNINYYLPNGQDIDVKQATAKDVAAAGPNANFGVGDLIHSNPYANMYGHQGEPAFVKVDAPYIQSLGAGALDPQKMAEAQGNTYKAQMEARKGMLQAQGEADTGLGRKFAGLAAIQNANSKEAMLDVDSRLKRADAHLKDSEANWYDERSTGARANSDQPKIPLAQIAVRQKQVYDMTNSLSQGQPTTAPVMVPSKDANGNVIMGPDGKPVMEPNLSPGAGRQQPDPTRIPVWLKNPDGSAFSPEQQHNVTVVGGQIAAANPTLPVSHAVELGARITQQETRPTSHKDPQTGKTMKDFVYDPQNGTARIWMGNAYENVYLRPNVADEGAVGNDQPPPSSAGSTPGEAEGGSAGPDAFQ
jgi:hypothetical protein